LPAPRLRFRTEAWSVAGVAEWRLAAGASCWVVCTRFAGLFAI
jgi:hypothetical protein